MTAGRAEFRGHVRNSSFNMQSLRCLLVIKMEVLRRPGSETSGIQRNGPGCQRGGGRQMRERRWKRGEDEPRA